MATADPSAIWHQAFHGAQLAKPRVGTNPAVGAVVVHRPSGAVVATGATGAPGTHHAETAALGAIPDHIPRRECDLYVTLEPCSHQGRTPPCTRAIKEAGVASVHIALLDLNPKVLGHSQKELEAANIPVAFDCPPPIAKKIFDLNASFHAATILGRPWVVAKWAMTLDGRLAARTGHSKWVSGPESLQAVQELRRRAQAVAVGGRTALLDNPRLLPRDQVSGPLPLRVIFDRRGLTPFHHEVVTGEAPSLFVGGPDTPLPFRKHIESAGKVFFDGSRGLAPVLEHLYSTFHVHEILIEGGASLLGAFFKEDLVDGAEVFVAPKILGDSQGVPVIEGGLRVDEINQGPLLYKPQWTPRGSDMQASGVLHPGLLNQAWTRSNPANRHQVP